MKLSALTLGVLTTLFACESLIDIPEPEPSGCPGPKFSLQSNRKAQGGTFIANLNGRNWVAQYPFCLSCSGCEQRVCYTNFQKSNFPRPGGRLRFTRKWGYYGDRESLPDSCTGRLDHDEFLELELLTDSVGIDRFDPETVRYFDYPARKNYLLDTTKIQRFRITQRRVNPDGQDFLVGNLMFHFVHEDDPTDTLSFQRGDFIAAADLD